MINIEFEGKLSELISATSWGFIMHMNQTKNSPDVSVYFTSKENAYGILQREWYDGNFWPVGFDKPHSGKYASLKPSRTVYKDTSSAQCRKEFFWKCGLDFPTSRGRWRRSQSNV